MNAIEFYNLMREKFPHDRLRVGQFVNPMFNHHAFPDVQFIYPNGVIIPPLNSGANHIILADPLEGPFYRLSIVCAIFCDKHCEWFDVSIVVQTSDGELLSSCPISIKGKKMSIKKEIGDLCGNEWYQVDTTVVPCRLVKYEQLVQESII